MRRSDISRRRADAGMTLVELIISFTITGMLLVVASRALLFVMGATPSTEARIDDARSTRMLSTYLAQDTMSAPAHEPELAVGGFDISPSPTATNNDCNAAGSNIVHLQWEEGVLTSSTTFVANYRYVVDGDAAHVQRVLCHSVDGAAFVTTSSRSITPDLDPASVPVAIVQKNATTGDVEVLSFELVGPSGEAVEIETAPRNPAEFFP